jgi:hypothetical protein
MKLDNTTIRGLIAVIGAIALVVRPDKIVEINAAIFSLIGMINIVRNPTPPVP